MSQIMNLVDRFSGIVDALQLSHLREIVQSRYDQGVRQAQEFKNENPNENLMTGPLQGYADELANCTRIILESAEFSNTLDLAFYHAAHDEGFLSVFGK